MRKIKLLLASALSLIAWTGTMAQTDAEYEAALAAITDAGYYYIKTDVSGTYYYLTVDGTLSATKDDGGVFQFSKVKGEFKEYGFNVHGNSYFSNPPSTLTGGKLNLNPDGRPIWEAQVFFLNSEGKYAVRCTNAAPGSGWDSDAFWTVADGPVAQYSTTANYLWELEEVTSLINVTYNVYFNDTKIDEIVTKQLPNSATEAPSILANDYCTFEFSAPNVGTTDTSVDITVTWNGPFTIADSYEDITWYNLYLHRSKDWYFSYANTEPYHPTADATEKQRAADAFQWGFVGNPYKMKVYNKQTGSSKTLKNDNNIAMRDGDFYWSVKVKYHTHGDKTGFMIGLTGNVNSFLNQFGGESADSYLGLYGSRTDQGSSFFIDDVPEIPVTSVYYDITFNGDVVKSYRIDGLEIGEDIPAIPDEIKRDFVTYDYDGTVKVSENLHVPVTATWDGPFEFSTDAENAHWYNMTIRSNYYAGVDETEPYYPKSKSLRELMDSKWQWAFAGDPINGVKVLNKSKGDGWTLKKETIKVSNQDKDCALMREADYSWTVLKNSNGFILKETGTANNCINQSGGKSGPLAFWNSTGALTDDGSTLRVFEVPIFVYYDVEYNSENVASVEVAQRPGDNLSLPSELKNGYVTYSEISGKVTEADQRVTVTATWDLNDLPFDVAPDFASANWQNLAMRGTWYVTSANKADDGALKTVNANAMGLVEDDYKWAFIGTDPYHIMLVNKAMGEEYVFVHTDNANQGIPTFAKPADVEDESDLYWNIRKSESSIENAFMLSVNGTNLSINQYGGAGGSVKFWNSANNYGDAGSAFTIFDVPTNFAEFTGAIEAALKATGYFAYNDATRALWKDEYKTDCPYDTYVKLQEAIDDMDNIEWPETGYYILKNKNYGTYMGIDPSDANMYGNYKTAVAAKQIVKLTKTGDATYTIGLMGKFAPATVTKSGQVTATAEAGTYTVSIPTVGYAAFQTNPAEGSEGYSALHCAGGGSIVGWTTDAAASQWEVEDAESIQLTIGAEGYATAYLPFPVQYGGPLPVPEALGTWTFDDPSDLLAGTGIATLQATTHAKNNVTVTDLATAGITSVEGPDADNGAVNVPVGSSLLMAANNGAANIGTYSIMYDVCVEDGSTYVPLLQNNLTDSKDGSLFIYKNQVGLGGGIGYHGSIENNKWYRIVFTVSPSEASLYVDGNLLTTYNQNFDNVNGSYLKHWVLTTGALFFADESGEEKDIKTSELRFWDIALNAEQVADLGSISGDAPAFPEALGTWTFEDATDPYAGTGTATIAEWGNGVTFDEGVATVPVGAGIELSTNLESTPSAYTLMQDVKLANVSGFISLFQNDVDNGKDGSIFVKDGTVGLKSAGLGYNGTINADTWYRIVTVIDNSYCTLYVDGVQVGKSASADVNAWAMRDSRKLLLFVDNSGEEAVVQLAEARFWDKALTAAQVAELATVGTTIDEGEAEAKDAVAYTATFDGSKTWLELSEVNGTIPTKTAVILKGAPKTYVYNIVDEAAPIENNVLMGSLVPIEPTGKYVLAKPAGQKVGFYKADPEKGNIPAGKAYLVSNDASIKAFYFAGDDATGIESVNSQNSLNTLNTQNSTIYNLAGQRISKMQKGINIVNGKKILK